jgi:hypothetical protein
MDNIQYVKHCATSLLNAYANKSKLTDEIISMEGMTGSKTRHFYNNLLDCGFLKTYLEVGSWKGSSFVSAMYGNNIEGYSIDDWSEFGGPKEEFHNAIGRHLKGRRYAIFDEDCFAFDTAKLKPIDIYLYDGNHSYESQKKAITHYYDALNELFILVVDDYNWHDVQNGTKDGLDEVGAEVVWEHKIKYNEDNQHTERDTAHREFWNGMYVAVCAKKKYSTNDTASSEKLRLMIHNPNNGFLREFRDHSVFWDEIVGLLRESHDVCESNFCEKAHLEDAKIYLSRRTRDHLQVKNCEMVIENLGTGDFYVLSLADQISPAVLAEQDNPHLKAVLYSQYVPDQILFHTGKNAHKYRPWIYFPQNSADFDGLYAKRQDMASLKEKMYFKGTREYRPIIGHIDPSLLSDNGGLGYREYLEEMMGYRLALSVGGAANGDMCYRDVECMALGVPMIRFEYVVGLNPNLIPNYHYFSIPIPDDLPVHNAVKKDRLGEKRHAEMIEQRFREVVNDLDYLNFVSDNSRRYYVENLSAKVRARNTLLKLGLIK